MRPVLPIAVGLLAAALAAPLALRAARAEASPPRAVIEETVAQVILVLEEEGLSGEERRGRVEAIAHERFDFDTMSRLVLARNWRRFSEGQQAAFQDSFKTFLAKEYGNRLDSYDQQQVDILGERQEPRGDVTVRTRIVGGDFEGADVDYRLREREGVWKVIDVVIEGISLVSNYRDQFREVLSRGGPDELLKKLAEKNAARAPTAPAAAS